MKASILAWGEFGKVTLPAALGINHWVLIPVFVAAFIGLFVWFEKKQL
jgi:chloramphenicol O-acetyltransferase